MIANLTIGPGCRLQFDYADPNGDVRGGHVVVDWLHNYDVPFDPLRAFPSDVLITGTTSGKITVYAHSCPRDHVVLYDLAHNRSNKLEPP